MRELERANTFTELITLLQNSRRNGTQKFSYSQLAKKLGYRSPRTLAMIHKEQRLPNTNLVHKIITHFEFSPFEIELTFLLAEKACAERKQISFSEIDKKIDSLKRILVTSESLEEFQQPQDEFLHLDSCELGIVKNKIEDFYQNFRLRYAHNSTKKLYRFRLRVSLSEK